jgi:hypothetical protein
MQGIPFRVVLLSSTLLWLANNIITGSIGGTVLEVANAAINIWTMIRMAKSAPDVLSSQDELAGA